MPKVAITGGIASGKSTFTAQFAALLRAPVFDADRCGRQLLAADPAVFAEVRAAFGVGVVDGAGAIDRTALRHIVFGDDPGPRRALEAILHPRVRAAWRAWLEEELQKSPDAVLLVEIPLLYETGAAEFFDEVIVVGCRPDTQLARLIGERRLPEAVARRIIASQWDLSEKIRLCDHLVWNEGPPSSLTSQAALCASLFPVPPPR